MVLGQAIATVSLAKAERFVEQLDRTNPVSRGPPIAEMAKSDPPRNRLRQPA